MSHRLSYFGSVDQCAHNTYICRSILEIDLPLDQRTWDLNIKFVFPNKVGPRLETMNKLNTISGFPGGPVNGVEHLYLEAFLSDGKTPDFMDLCGSWTEQAVVPMCEFNFVKDTEPDVSLPPEGATANMFRLQRVTCHETREYIDYTVDFQMYLHLLPTEGTIFPPPLRWVVRMRKGDTGYLVQMNSDIFCRDALNFQFKDLFSVDVFFIQLDRTSDSNVALPENIWGSLIRWFKLESVIIKQAGKDREVVRDTIIEAVSQAFITDAISLENCQDMTRVASTINGAVDMAASAAMLIKTKNPLMLLKFVASVHLMWRYVIRTSYKDLLDLCRLGNYLWAHRAEWIKSISYQRGRSSPVTVTEVLDSTHTLTCRYRTRLDLKPAPFYFAEYARCIGIAPTIGNFWDLIPLSFVVDWLIPIGDMIESKQIILDLTSSGMDNLYVTTVKSSLDVNIQVAPSIWMKGELVKFSRNVSRDYQGSRQPVNPFLKVNNPSKQFWTAAALTATFLIRGKKKRRP